MSYLLLTSAMAALTPKRSRKKSYSLVMNLLQLENQLLNEHKGKTKEEEVAYLQGKGIALLMKLIVSATTHLSKLFFFFFFKEHPFT